VSETPDNHESTRLAEMLDIIFRFAAGDLSARGTLSGDDSALDGVMAGINILGEELGAHVAEHRQALEFAQTLTRSSPDGILAVNPDLKISEWNPLMERICGQSKEQVIGHYLEEIPLLRETGEVTRIKLAFDGKRIDTRDFEYRFPGSGLIRYFESTIAPLVNPSGQIQGALLRVRDITERVVAERSLTESEDQFRAIFNSVRDGIILGEAQSRRFRMVNASICVMLGYSAEELIRIGVEGIHPHENISYVHSQFERLARNEIGIAPNLPMMRKDGSVFYADVNVGPITLDGIPCLVGVFRDVTERRRAQQDLTESEALLRAIFDAGQDGILLIEVKTQRFRMGNAAMCRMLGYGQDELLELRTEDIHPEENLADVVLQIERLIKREITIAQNLPVKKKDGSVFFVDINAVSLQAKGDSFILAAFKDISERMRADEAEERASRDSLTDLYNHRTFHALLEEEITRSRRFNRPVSLLMIDIDHFKLVNDTHGHQAGDTILKKLSKILLKCSREVDRVCRYGGEEFTLILPETGATEAEKLAERLRLAVQKHSFEVDGNKTVSVTVSIGIASYPQHADTLQDLVGASDTALYAAKEGGRNRVCSATCT
jgi:diguanylate cyclase (GGDEF)-like protein/PAS domain S-box-containing protein